MKIEAKKDLRRLITVVLASLLMAINIKTFVRTGGLYPGGATGLTILIQRISQMYLPHEIPYSPINILLNAIPVYIGFRFIGKKFTFFSLIMILLTGFFTDLMPAHVITYDTLLIAIFGGIINGVVISLCLSVDATTGGTDFIAIYLSQKRGMETVSYTHLTLPTLYRDFQRQTLFIVTDKAEEIAKMIFDETHHGASIMQAEGAHEHKNHQVLYSVIAADSARHVIKRIREIDAHAFVNSIRTTELAGRFYMKPKD